ncbi:MAG: hypothetical protein PHV97_04230, partial [Candidatus Omnitrophica bacterium]|nr:hypothetical protein [Candidatus Omnitrophota bacterium]
VFLKLWIPGPGTRAQLVQVFGSILIATVSYLGLCFVCRVPEVKEAFAWFRKKRKLAGNPIDAENLMDGA